MDEIKEIEISRLIPYSQNNRKHSEDQVDRIAESITRFGFNQPIVCDEDMIVLVGHGRLLAAKKLQLDTVPVLVREKLTDTQKRAYRILDNKLQNDSEWDFDALSVEIELLKDDEFDVDFWGLQDLVIDDSVIEVVEESEEGSEISDDDIFIKEGDVIQLNDHSVICGDSSNLDLIKSVFCKAEMLFTDPPYGVDYDGGHFHSGDVNIKRSKEKLANDKNTSMYAVTALAAKHLIDGPCYTWFAGTKVVSAIDPILEYGELHSLLVWHKINAKYAAMSSQYKPRHEFCAYWKPKKCTLRWCGDSTESTLWEVKRDPINNYHPTQKPIELAFRAIKNHTSSSVLDLFLGSGSTLMACEQLGRTCYGVEISPKYCHVIIERWVAFMEQQGKKYSVKINGEETRSSAS